ncbi:MAG: heme lyase CcmF/NrfE family subunit [Betaproteobacteria bacterium]|nr:heme lyase CcmF/NrfE family subunit [Betaproteobacteria bacterium]
MIPEIGQFALLLALCVALVQGTLPLVGAARGNVRWMAIARPAAMAQFLFVAIAFSCLAWSFVNNDFSVLNVAQNSNSHLPLHYRFAATWGSHEGSLLLWLFMLTAWMTAVALFSRHLPEAMTARILSVMALVSIGFLLFMIITSNPFARLLPAADDGNDLNPLLQDPGMVIHPPMLYMGYVGFSVAFAFAIAALLGGKLDATWARWSRPWTTAAWMFLTVGICLGSAWAYYELGWGGWWFWDPVENASFMPWLVGTALMHSLAVTEKRGGFKIWTVLLAIIAFSLSLLGTFLVRSGVLTSVHAFATDPARGVFILLFLSVVVGGSLALFAWRAPKVGVGGQFELVSREAALLTNNVLLLVAAASVLLGTLYPLFLDALDLGKISVGPPYFDTVFVPLMTPALFLMGLGPMARWKRAELPDLFTRLRWAAAVAAVTAAIVPFLMGRWSPMIFLGLLMAFWILASSAANLKERLSQVTAVNGGSLSRAFRAQPRGYWGMLIAHCGVAVFIVGVTMVKSYETERDVKMSTGDIVDIAGYGFRLDGFEKRRGPNYEATVGKITVLRDGREVLHMFPEKRFYSVQQMPMTEADIDTGLTRDLYVSLGEPVGDNAWVVRLYHKPFVDWIWGGGFIMAFGGFIALTDRRYRLERRAVRAGASNVVGASA